MESEDTFMGFFYYVLAIGLHRVSSLISIMDVTITSEWTGVLSGALTESIQAKGHHLTHRRAVETVDVKLSKQAGPAPSTFPMGAPVRAPSQRGMSSFHGP